MPTCEPTADYADFTDWLIRPQGRHSATATRAPAGDSNLWGSANLVRATWKFRRSNSA